MIGFHTKHIYKIPYLEPKSLLIPTIQLWKLPGTVNEEEEEGRITQ